MVHRREHVVVVDRVVGRLGRRRVGRADHLADLHAAAGQQGAVDPGPVVTPGLLVDLRRAAEFAPHEQRRRLVQAAHGQVFDQRRDAGVK